VAETSSCLIDPSQPIRTAIKTRATRRNPIVSRLLRKAVFLYQKMNVIGRHHVIEHAQAKAFLGLEQPMQIAPPITGSEKEIDPLQFLERLERSEAVERLERLELAAQY
jgi:hypothetical protein